MTKQQQLVFQSIPSFSQQIDSQDFLMHYFLTHFLIHKLCASIYVYKGCLEMQLCIHAPIPRLGESMCPHAIIHIRKPQKNDHLAQESNSYQKSTC